jgi:hypothetical protein
MTCKLLAHHSRHCAPLPLQQQRRHVHLDASSSVSRGVVGKCRLCAPLPPPPQQQHQHAHNSSPSDHCLRGRRLGAAINSHARLTLASPLPWLAAAATDGPICALLRRWRWRLRRRACAGAWSGGACSCRWQSSASASTRAAGTGYGMGTTRSVRRPSLLCPAGSSRPVAAACLASSGVSTDTCPAARSAV